MDRYWPGSHSLSYMIRFLINKNFCPCFQNPYTVTHLPEKLFLIHCCVDAVQPTGPFKVLNWQHFLSSHIFIRKSLGIFLCKRSYKNVILKTLCYMHTRKVIFFRHWSVCYGTIFGKTLFFPPKKRWYCFNYPEAVLLLKMLST